MSNIFLMLVSYLYSLINFVYMFFTYFLEVNTYFENDYSYVRLLWQAISSLWSANMYRVSDSYTKHLVFEFVEFWSFNLYLWQLQNDLFLTKFYATKYPLATWPWAKKKKVSAVIHDLLQL